MIAVPRVQRGAVRLDALSVARAARAPPLLTFAMLRDAPIGAVLSSDRPRGPIELNLSRAVAVLRGRDPSIRMVAAPSIAYSARVLMVADERPGGCG